MKPGAATRLGQELIADGYRGLGPEQLLFGRPAEVAEQLRPYSELGFTDVICRCMTIPQQAALESIELLAEVRELLVA